MWHQTLPVDKCPADGMILDAGPETVARLARVFEGCKTLIWNGPLGAFELAPFDAATMAAARKVAALNKAGVAGDFSYISTAGGAFLEWMEGKTLPGVAALKP